MHHLIATIRWLRVEEMLHRHSFRVEMCKLDGSLLQTRLGMVCEQKRARVSICYHERRATFVVKGRLFQQPLPTRRWEKLAIGFVDDEVICTLGEKAVVLFFEMWQPDRDRRGAVQSISNAAA